MVKTFTYLITFSITILICLWLFQVEFLKLFYEQYQIKDIKNVASDIIKSNSISKLEKLAYENDICIELKINDEIIDYNTLNKDCILKSKNSRVQKLKESLYSNNKTKIGANFYGITLSYPKDSNITINGGIRLDWSY